MPELRKDRLTERPKIHGYHDYRSFLRDWFSYLKEELGRFSLRGLSAEAKISSAYLSLVLSGRCDLSPKALGKLAPHLHLNRSELSYLENLVKLGSNGSIEGQVQALKRMKNSHNYKKLNPNEVEYFQYMSEWYRIVIREMAALGDFKLDAAWIRGRLRKKLPISVIQEALDFLVENRYLTLDEHGRVSSPAAKEMLDCDSAVFSKTLKYYHKQMLELAAESLTETPAQERNLVGLTFSLDSSDFEKARKILDRAVEEIEALQKARTTPRDSVYHLEVALFPTTASSRKRMPGSGEKK